MAFQERVSDVVQLRLLGCLSYLLSVSAKCQLRPSRRLPIFIGKVVFSWANMIIILFLKSRFVKYEKHLLMWKLILDSCTLSRLCFFYRVCPSRYPRQQPISARAKTEPVFFCKIKHKKHPRRLTVVPPSVSFGTHSSHLSTLYHGGEVEVPTRKP